MIEFSPKEIKFLQSLEESRLATCHDDIPHVKPVSYIFYQNSILIATDYKTRTYKNIQENPKTAIVIDVYKSGEHKAICIQGNTQIIEKGSEFQEIYKLFYAKFQWVRAEPWGEMEAPFLKIIPITKSSWGID